MVRVMKPARYKLSVEDVLARSDIKKSNISMRGEHNRHKRPINLAKLKFLEKNDKFK
jgi:hypothetical protein